MRAFNISVNGNPYYVEVEETGLSASSINTAKPAHTQQVQPTPTIPKIVEPAAPVAAVGTGTKVEAPMPGTIMNVNVAVGDEIKSGQTIVVLEAMKMENDIVSPIDGKVTSLMVKKGDTVNSNDVIATIA